MIYKNYEFTRSIGFNLKEKDTQKIYPSFDRKFNSEKDRQEILKNFLNEYDNLINAFKKVVFYKEGEISFKLEIKYPWLKRYTKKQYYNSHNDKVKKYTVKEAPYLKQVFNDWLNANNELKNEMKDVFIRELHTQAKESDISLLTKKFLGHDNFSFVRDFIQYANCKDSEQYLDELRKVVEKIRTIAEDILQVTSPKQSHGIEVARGSFNFYTINKISKNFDEDISKWKDKFKQPSYNIKNIGYGFPDYIKTNYGVYKQDDLSIESLYKALKEFKSQQKKLFLEAIDKGEDIEEIKRKFSLFHRKNGLEEFINTTKQKRSKFFQNKWGFPNYIEFCDYYKKIAQERGRIKADIRALEQEKEEARLLMHWAHIIEYNGARKLLLLPKKGDNLYQAKKYLENINSLQGGDYILYSFNSLTLRVLNKLVRRNIPKEIPNLNEDPVAIYKKVLSGYYKKIDLDFLGFENQIQTIISKEYQNEEEFRIALESISYSLRKIVLTQKNINKLQNDYGALLLDITSYDLERKINNKKEHTALWEEFWSKENWSNNFPLRINPEFRIFFREKIKNQSYKKKRNRFSEDNLMVFFNLTQNVAQNKMEVAFKDRDGLVATVKQFNQDVVEPLIKETRDNLYYYGIDRGHTELATLGIVQFSNEKYRVEYKNGEVKEFCKPIFTKVKTYRIKDNYLNLTKEIEVDRKGNKKEVNIIENPSYFVEDDVLEEVNSSFINLTKAKLIKGKIILNGDVKTYLNLKEENAKRKIFNIYNEIVEESKIEYVDESHPASSKNQLKNAFVVPLTKKNRGHEILCYFDNEIAKYRSLKDMRKILQGYLDKLRANEQTEGISIDRINNLRDAITSNMVGIAAHLFEKYPGVINLENMNNTLENFKKNNEDISRRLEWSLYKKFRKYGLVPPLLRQTTFLREEGGKSDKSNKINQFGIINFVPIKNTSGECPYCRRKKTLKERKEEKFSKNSYFCPECDFNTKSPPIFMRSIDDSDKVAAYNIAKFGLGIRRGKNIK